MNTTDGWIEPSTDTEEFFEGARAGVLRLQQCDECHTHMYPLKHRCQKCGANSLSWSNASGQGTVYSYARLQREYHPHHAGRLPLVIAWIDLAEGVRAPGNIVDIEGKQLKVGVPVQVDFETDPAGTAFPVYRLT